jgi:hypothetical protein
MEKILVAVRLKAPDPSAMTALSTLRRVMPDECPVELDRYDLWEFTVEAGGRGTVTEVVEHFTDIVNPNKQKYSFVEEGTDLFPGEDPDLTWRGVVVSDHDDSLSANWTAVMLRRGFPVTGVAWSTLWRMAWPSGTGFSDAGRMALAVSTSVSREKGLLGNPVSQGIALLKKGP